MTDQFFGITDTGIHRQNNEDTFIAELSTDKKFIIACVIDGVGGYDGGEIAAGLARETIINVLKNPPGEVTETLKDCFNLANEKIMHEKQNSDLYPNMACVCTLAIADIEANRFYYAHVGDSRLYLVRDGSLVKLSQDQSFVGFLEDSGRISEEEAMGHPKRNEINKALGLDDGISKNEGYIETGESPFLPGDMLLLCSDGLTDMVNKAGIQAIVTGEDNLKDKCQKLVTAANNNGGRDNITVVLVQNNKDVQQYEAARPSAIKKNTPKPQIAFHKPDHHFKTKAISVITILSVSLIFFIAISTGLYLKSKKATQSQPTKLKPKEAESQLEIKLQQAINQSKGQLVVLVDTAYPAPILLSSAIRINRESLYIKAKGKIIIQSSPGYNGVAFLLSSKCKNIEMDSLSISNFVVGIITFNSGLALKNVLFNNCQAQIQNAFILPDKKYISIKLPVLPFRADSTPILKKQ